MLKRVPISLILLLAFLMLQVHNMMPHHHVEKVTISHSHKHDHHDHEHKSEKDHSSPLNKADHSAEFGEALIKPDNGKYELSPLNFIPLLQPAFQNEITALIKTIPQAITLSPNYLIPPDPYLQAIDLRGPPSFI